MQTCTRCQSVSADTAKICHQCGADLTLHSQKAVSLSRFLENPRIGRIRIIAHEDCCPNCSNIEGIWPKDDVPALPVPECSHPDGCRCFYLPELVELYP
jgi:hypothetical protein